MIMVSSRQIVVTGTWFGQKVDRVIIDGECDLGLAPALEAAFTSRGVHLVVVPVDYSENRRVRNDRLKQELGVVLRYPTYREGLRAIAAAA